MQNAGEDAHQDAALVVVPLSSGCFVQPDVFPANPILGNSESQGKKAGAVRDPGSFLSSV
jgi:hypothetical protein